MPEIAARKLTFRPAPKPSISDSRSGFSIIITMITESLSLPDFSTRFRLDPVLRSVVLELFTFRNNKSEKGLSDHHYLFLDGVSFRARRPGGRQRVHMLVAYGVGRDGTRQLLAFLRIQGES